MSLKSQIDQSFRAGFILLILALMACAECVLIAENAAFLQTQGKGQVSAFALASCVALLIPIAAAFRISRSNAEPNLWALIGKWVFVAALVSMQVWFASQTAIAPQLAQTIRETDKALIAQYQAQIQQYDSQIAEHQKRINAYTEKHRTRKTELTGEQAKLVNDRRVVLSELRTIAENAGNEPAGIQAVFNNTTILATILYRLALEISVIFLAVCLRRHFAGMPDYQAITDNAAAKINSKSALPEPEVEEQQSVNPREFVLDQFPNAVCKSKNGRQGPFCVYADQSEKTLLGKSKLNVDAWGIAAQHIRERRAA